MCSFRRGQPSDKTAQLLRASASRPLIMPRASDEKLLKPPSLKDVLEATEMFAPHYDEWMRETHHPLAIEMLRKYSEQDLLGDTIAEIGCGTGVLTANLMVSVQAKALLGLIMGEGYGRIRSPTFICLDQSEDMLKFARKNIETNLHEFIASAVLMGPSLSGEEFGVDSASEGDRMRLLCRGKEIAQIIFALSDAKELDRHEEIGGISTIIIAYAMHWFRGIEEKANVAAKMFDALAGGGTLISVEESPLVVRRDMHPNDPELQKLAVMIEKATTPLTIPEIHDIFRSVGFIPVPGAAQKKGIDEYHDMYGMAYRKP